MTRKFMCQGSRFMLRQILTSSQISSSLVVPSCSSSTRLSGAVFASLDGTFSVEDRQLRRRASISMLPKYGMQSYGRLPSSKLTLSTRVRRENVKNFGTIFLSILSKGYRFISELSIFLRNVINILPSYFDIFHFMI